MTVADPQKENYYMGAVGTFGGIQKAELKYNAFYDTEGGKPTRDRVLGQKAPDFFTGNINFAGTHELGHVPASTLIDTDRNKTASFLQNAHCHESGIMENVLGNPEIMPAEDFKKLGRYSEKDMEKSKTAKGTPRVVKGAIRSKHNGLYTKGYTSRYGADNPGEFFAEAFHDVYANGGNAKKTSIAVVQEYEKRQKRLTAEKFFRKKRILWQRFRNWMKM